MGRRNLLLVLLRPQLKAFRKRGTKQPFCHNSPLYMSSDSTHQEAAKADCMRHIMSSILT